jgi:hypothetical protein
MCHGFDSRDWRIEQEDEREDEEVESDPAFLKDETAEDVDILTDGGDE